MTMKRHLKVELDCSDEDYKKAANMVWHVLHFGLEKSATFNVYQDSKVTPAELNAAWDDLDANVRWS